MLRASDVEFAYAATANVASRDASRLPVLRGLSVEVPAASSVGILGPNGSGKTTLLRILSGTLKPTHGVVTLDAVPLERLSRTTLAQRMAVVPQETHLAFDYTVLEVVLMGRYVHLGAFEVEGPADVTIAREALAATGTLDLERRMFATLSGGEKQRVIIASALAQLRGSTVHPVLLLDEPTTALDLAYQLEAAELLRDLQRRFPIAIVVSTHDLNFAAAVCRTLVLLKDGRVLATGPTEEVLNAANILALYGVNADVHRHPEAGHLVVIPVSRDGGKERRP